MRYFIIINLKVKLINNKVFYLINDISIYFDCLSRLTFKLSQKNWVLFVSIPFSLSTSISSLYSINLLVFLLLLILSAVFFKISSKNSCATIEIILYTLGSDEINPFSWHICLIISTDNLRQNNSMSDEFLEKLKELDVEPYRIEGLNTDWILIDFGDIIVHFFTEEKRVFYNLEKVWADGIVLENN